jgi:proteasome assembly chaperone (PAC2) family protein
MLAAFAGWNDAGEAATAAVRHLSEVWSARPFGHIDAEEFFDFSTVRPQVKLTGGFQREILWPHTELLAAAVPGSRHDVVLLAGIEPQLKWRTYNEQVLAVARKLGVELVVTLGALLADVPHTRDVAIIGTAADQGLIDLHDLQHSRYEGPTGIVGTLQDACLRAGLPALSLWAAVPGYAQQHASPKAALALVERVATIVDTEIPVGALRDGAVTYEREVSEAVADDDDLASYVSRLEHMADNGIDDDEDDDDEDDNEEPPSADRLVAEVEQFLRDQGRNDG